MNKVDLFWFGLVMGFGANTVLASSINTYQLIGQLAVGAVAVCYLSHSIYSVWRSK